MKNWLKRLRINRVALVDKGANPDADVVLFKRDDVEKQDYASMEECMAALGDESKCKALMAAMKRAELEGDRMTDKLPEDVTKALAEVADLKKRAETAEANAKAAADRIAKMEADEQNRAAIAKVAMFKSLPVNADEFGPLYRKMTKDLSAEEIAKVDAVFHAASEQIAAGKLLAEVGSSKAAPGGDAYAKIEAGAAALIQKDGKLSAIEAEKRFLETPEGKKLYDEYEAERQAAARGR